MTTIYWRDIPAQLTAQADGEQHKVLLHARFQHAIDRAAGVAGLTSTHDYVQQWRREPAPPAAGDVNAHLDQRCAELEAAYPRERLEALVANGGLEPVETDAVGPARPPAGDDARSDEEHGGADDIEIDIEKDTP